MPASVLNQIWNVIKTTDFLLVQSYYDRGFRYEILLYQEYFYQQFLYDSNDKILPMFSCKIKHDARCPFYSNLANNMCFVKLHYHYRIIADAHGLSNVNVKRCYLLASEGKAVWTMSMHAMNRHKGHALFNQYFVRTFIRRNSKGAH